MENGFDGRLHYFMGLPLLLFRIPPFHVTHMHALNIAARYYKRDVRNLTHSLIQPALCWRPSRSIHQICKPRVLLFVGRTRTTSYLLMFIEI